MTQSAESNVKALGFNPEALRKKYHDEREKRMDHAGSRKYVKLRGNFDRLYKDPNANPDYKRDPVKKEMDFAFCAAPS
jgi:hypothetical protein